MKLKQKGSDGAKRGILGVVAGSTEARAVCWDSAVVNHVSAREKFERKRAQHGNPYPHRAESQLWNRKRIEELISGPDLRGLHVDGALGLGRPEPWQALRELAGLQLESDRL